MRRYLVPKEYITEECAVLSSVSWQAPCKSETTNFSSRFPCLGEYLPQIRGELN